MKNSKFGNWDLPIIGSTKSDKKKTQLYLCDLEKLKDALKGEIDGKRK